MKESKIEIIEPDYEGMSKVLSSLAKLYRVCDNTELLDSCLHRTFNPTRIVTGSDLMNKKDC